MPATVTSIKASSAAYLGDSTKIVDLTPTKAAEMLKHLYENQRPIIDRHVRALNDLYDHGKWRGTSIVTVVRGLPSGNYIVVNGAHRLTFVSRQTKAIPITLRWLDVPDANLVAEAEAEYRTHDVNGKSRSMKDMLWSYEDLRSLGFEPHELNQVGAATNFIDLGFPTTSCGVDMKNRNADIRVGPILEYAEAAKKYLALIGAAKKTGLLYKELVKRPAMAAGILLCNSLLNSDADLKTFFYTVSRDDGLAAGDPRKILVDLIKERWRRSNGKPYNDVERAIIVRKAWNAWLNGDAPEYFRVDADTVLKASELLNA